MDWLPPSLFGSLLATLIMVAICLFVYTIERQRFLLLWALGWGCFSARVGGEIGLHSFPDSALIVLATQLVNLGIGYFLALGTFAFLEKSVPRLVHWCALAAALFLLAAWTAGFHEFWVSLPAYLFIGLASLWTGIAVLRSPKLGGVGGLVCGWSIILWGLHRAGHAFLLSFTWLTPLNYLLATVLSVGMALGLMLAYFQRTKTALRASEQSYHQLLESAADAIYVVVRDDKNLPSSFVEANQVAHQRLGYTRAEFLQLSFLEIVAPSERHRIAELAEALAVHGRLTFEGREFTKDGREIPVDVSLHQGWWGGRPVTLSISRDITARKNAETKLNELAAIVANSKDSIVGFDLSGTITSWNQGAEKLYGYTAEEALGLSLSQLLPAGERGRAAATLEAIQQGTPLERHDTARLTKDGRIIYIDVTISPVRNEAGEVVGGSAIGRDKSEAKRQQEEKESILAQLRQSQKMEALGTLAGGIAHDFNNILSVIMGSAEMALLRQRKNLAALTEMERVLSASRRARDLVRQILTFSRRSEKQRRSVPLKPLIAETLRMLRSTLPASINISRQIVAQDDLVKADPTQLHQVLMNLCTNAAQAMEPDPGVLTVSLREVEVGEQGEGTSAGLKPGPYLLLAVSDTGRGMAPEVMERALEPFFTTKEPGQGTGLGLAVVHGIVEAHHGALRFHSQPGRGSTFEVYLPRLERQPEAGHGAQRDIARGSERVLLVDDETSFCEIERERLQWLGYRVTAHTDSLAALRALESEAAFDLLVVDLVMPGLDGLELARRARALRPKLPVVVITGYSDKITPTHAAELSLKAVLIKPVSLEDMSAALRQALA